MKKEKALSIIDDLVEKYEKDLEEITKVLPKTVKHKHMFNDIEYCLGNIKSNIDMLTELKKEIEESDKEEMKEKSEAFKEYGFASPCYDFAWDDEEEED